MKALIPAAGIGTRLRPHTLNKPKALLPVAGRPILGHIMDDLLAAGIEGFVLVVGYCGGAVRTWAKETYPDLDITFVEQRERLGLGHAVWTARDALDDEPFFCILGDTILKADYQALLSGRINTIAVKKVPDPRRFGVVEMAGDRVVRFVEKPDIPPSDLAIVGAYLFTDGGELLRALDRIVADDLRTRGEYQLTDGLEILLRAGRPFGIEHVEDWYDCGKKETWLATNRVLLDAAGGGGVGADGPCWIHRTATVENSRLGPHVSIGPGVHVVDSVLSDCVVGSRSEIRSSRLSASLVGENAVVAGAVGSVNLGDYCEYSGASDTDA